MQIEVESVVMANLSNFDLIITPRAIVKNIFRLHCLCWVHVPHPKHEFKLDHYESLH